MTAVRDADDNGGHGAAVEHPARRHVGDRDAVLRGDWREGRQEALQAVPATGFVDDQAILDERPVGER